MSEDSIEGVGWRLPPAQHQTVSPPEEILHSGNCGLIIHRVGQFNLEFRAEGRAFARTLQQHLNRVTHPQATTLLYEEIFGTEDRFHWLVHLRAPNDYLQFIRMADEDADLQEIVESDRLPEKGGGNWERMFVEGSFQEAVMVPQHGLVHAGDGALRDGLFVPPARCQTSLPAEQMLHSANAKFIVHRSGQVRYAFREEGRAFAYEWQDYVNRALAGEVTIFLYEETWGRQDRIHWLIHLRSLDAFGEILAMGGEEADYRAIFSRQRIPASRGGGTWARMFVDGSIEDRVLIPHHEGMGMGWF